MIGPVYGNGSKASGAQPNGIIQFINKNNDAPITEEEQRKFTEISELLGMCIQNTYNVTKTIGVTLELNANMERITNMMDQVNSIAKETPTTDILKEVGKSVTEMRALQSKLLETR